MRADGFTAMVNVDAVPLQTTPPLVKLGVTVIVAVTGEVPVLTAVNEAMLPVPLADKPMAGLLLLQVNSVPFTDPLSTIGDVDAPLQITMLLTGFRVGVGLTVKVKLVGVPKQVAPPLE